jgi:6-phosphogluconolactonase (cycloisomerase 2 family)
MVMSLAATAGIITGMVLRGAQFGGLGMMGGGRRDDRSGVPVWLLILLASVVVYAIDARSGELSFKQRVPSGGKVPRYFSFDPSNQWLLVANQEGGNVVIFQVDAKTGELSQKGPPVVLPRPMGVVFAPR